MSPINAGGNMGRNAAQGRGPGRRMGTEKPKNLKGTLARLIAYLASSKGLLAVVLVCVVLSTFAQLAGGYAISPVINLITETLRTGGGMNALARGLIPLLTVLGCIYIVSVVSTYLMSRLMITISQRTVRRLRGELFCCLQKLPVKYYDTHTHGELMSRFTNDIDMVSEALNNTIISLVSNVLNFSGTVVMMIVISPILSLVPLLLIPLSILLIRFIVRRSRRYFTEQQAAIGALNGYIEETMEGQRVVKVFCREERVMSEFSQFNGNYRKKAALANIGSGIMIPLMQNIGSISYALTSTLGGFLCIARGFNLGSLGAFLNYSRQYERPLMEIANLFTVVQSGLAGAERIFQVMDENPEPADCDNPVAPLALRGHVVFSDVSFGYVPDRLVLKHISLEAHPGEKVALVGSTGAGKTTITNLLTRFYDIQEGSITIDGIDIQTIERTSLRKNIAMVLQDTHLFTGTIMENIRYGRLDATDEECVKAARMANADSFIRKLPEGYETQLSSDGSELSQGQRQLLNIARAAVANPAVLVLDEATSSIDTRTELMIEKGMDRLMEKRTTFVIAHRLSTVRNADVILVIENGEIIEHGSHDELVKVKGRYYQLYSGQSVLG